MSLACSHIHFTVTKFNRTMSTGVSFPLNNIRCKVTNSSVVVISRLKRSGALVPEAEGPLVSVSKSGARQHSINSTQRSVLEDDRVRCGRKSVIRSRLVRHYHSDVGTVFMDFYGEVSSTVDHAQSVRRRQEMHDNSAARARIERVVVHSCDVRSGQGGVEHHNVRQQGIAH